MANKRRSPSAMLCFVRCCHVRMKGTDGKLHCVTLQACSLYDVANKALNAWSRLWWFDPSTVVIVKSSEDVWHIRQENVRRSAGYPEGLIVRCGEQGHVEEGCPGLHSSALNLGYGGAADPNIVC